MKRVAVVGASGYTGQEVIRWLRRHPAMELAVATSARADAPARPAGEGAPDEPAVAPFDPARLEGLDGAFLCTPHGAATTIARECLALGLRVVDLSADFRLRDPRAYRETYGSEHGAPELLSEAVYGLTEHERDRVASASLVANPGCYPTAVLLPLLPILRRGLADPHAPIVADCKSGVSGAGKTPSERTHFGNVHENFLAYGVGDHRHAPEIDQEAGTDRIAFVPHLLPIFRGILATIYVQPAPGVGAGEVQHALRDAYAEEPFVRVLENRLPEIADVRLTNRCLLGVRRVGGTVVLVSAIDNLVKGAAGQAIQNMNLMLGLEEAEGLR